MFKVCDIRFGYTDSTNCSIYFTKSAMTEHNHCQ